MLRINNKGVQNGVSKTALFCEFYYASFIFTPCLRNGAFSIYAAVVGPSHAPSVKGVSAH